MMRFQTEDNKLKPALLIAFATLWSMAPLSMAQAQNAAGNVITPPPVIRFTVNAFVVSGQNPLSESTTQGVLAPYLGEHTGLEKLDQAAQALENKLRQAGHSLHRVVIPPQETTGVVKLEIATFTVGTLKVTGAKFFDEANLRASVPSLQVGTSPDLLRVAQQLAIANESPAKQTVLALKEGEQPDTVDATLEVRDQRTWNGLLLANNTGTLDTGRTRVTAALQHNNLFNRDHSATLAYTSSPEKGQNVIQYGAQYRAPVYSWGGVFNLAHSYSSVDSGSLGSGLNITGRGTVSSFGYVQQLLPWGPYRSSLGLNIDDKLYRGITLLGVQLTPDVRSRPLTLNYTGRYEAAWGVWGFNADYVHNLNGGGSNNDPAYAANRVGATTKWESYRVGSDLAIFLPKNWMAVGKFRGQYTPDALIAGEQFGVGGATTVRGLNERVLTGDRGTLGSVELWTPPLFTNRLRFLAFVDQARVERRPAVAPLGVYETIQSVGGGLRLSLMRDLSFSLDYGKITQGALSPDIQNGTYKWHGAVQMKF